MASERVLPQYGRTGWTGSTNTTPWDPVPSRVLPRDEALRRRAELGGDEPTYALVTLRDGNPVPGTAPIVLDAASAFTCGRGEGCDILTAHPSCSTTHAVLCFKRPLPTRWLEPPLPMGAEDETRDPAWFVPQLPDGAVGDLYVVDLGSTNGTRINGERILPWLYYPLLPDDALTFGLSSRQLVVVEK